MTMAESRDSNAQSLCWISILLSLGIIGTLKGIVLSNHQCAPIYLDVSTYKYEETSLSREVKLMEHTSLMWPAQEKVNNLPCKDRQIM